MHTVRQSVVACLTLDDALITHTHTHLNAFQATICSAYEKTDMFAIKYTVCFPKQTHLEANLVCLARDMKLIEKYFGTSMGIFCETDSFHHTLQISINKYCKMFIKFYLNWENNCMGIGENDCICMQILEVFF